MKKLSRDSTGHEDVLSRMNRIIHDQQQLLHDQSEVVTKLLMREQPKQVSRDEVISLAMEIHTEVVSGTFCALDVDSAIWEFLQKKGIVD